MKILSVLRHAKAKRPWKYETDVERPLTKRGRRDARNMGVWVAHTAPPVDLLISSPSMRTKETVEEMLKKMKYTQPISWAEEVYDATAEDLLTLLRHAPGNTEHILLVGHNPSVAQLVAGLCAGSPQRLNLHMPTGTWAHLYLEIFQWDQIRWGCGVLRAFSPPKLIRDRL